MSEARAARPPRVALVSSHAELGGEELYLERLAERLGAEWVAGVVSLARGPHADRLERLGPPVRVVPTPARAGMLPAAVRLRRELQSLDPQVVHANGVKAALVCAMASIGAPWKLIWVKHDFSWDGRLSRLVRRRCELVVGVSEAALAVFGPDDDGVRVVSNGVVSGEVDRDEARARAEDMFAGTAKGPIVCTAGRICPPKGQMELVETATELDERVPGVRFVVIGGEDSSFSGHSRELRERADELGVADRFVYAGRVEPAEAVSLIAAADALAAPSMRDPASGWQEGFGQSVAEAMWAGTPVVAYSNGSLPEIVGECGRVVPEGDRGALVAGLAEVLADSDLAASLAACGRRRVEERFRFEWTVEGMRRAYVDAVRGT